MAEIGQLTPAHPVVPARPGTAAGQGNEAPQRKPESDTGQRDRKRRQENHGDGDASHIDEYA